MILKLLNPMEEEIQADWATAHAATRYVRQYFTSNDDITEVVNGVRQIEDDEATDFIGEKYITGGYAPVRKGDSFSWIPR